jgi:uncharacterized protein YkwD
MNLVRLLSKADTRSLFGWNCFCVSQTVELFLRMRFIAAIFSVLCLLALPSAAVRRSGEPQIYVSSLERHVQDRINDERSDRKLRDLDWDERLSRIARAHSEDMARRKFFDHVNPDGRNPTDRGKAAGYECRKVHGTYYRVGLGENLYQGSLYSRIRITGTERIYDWNSPADLARQSVSGWMKSPGHRRNILEKDYSRAGVGIAISPDDEVFITQLFC